MEFNYRSYEFQAYDLIRQMEKLLSEESSVHQAELWSRQLVQSRRNLEQRRFRIAVVGEFNRGKTSFVNALLGKEILPADYIPTTAAVNRITYSDEPGAYLLFKNGKRESVQISELSGYVTKLTEASAEQASNLKEAVVEYPSLLCRNGVDLIDTPGMNDEDAMNAVTISKLMDIDLAILAVDPSMPFSMTECMFTAQMLESQQICQIIVAVTKIDMVREKEREKTVAFIKQRIQDSVKKYLLQYYEEESEVLKKYHQIFDDLQIFPAASLGALEALACNDMEAYERSGFRELNDRLPLIILKTQNRSVILNTIRDLKKTIEQYRDQIQEKQKHNPCLLRQLQALKQSFEQYKTAQTIKLFAPLEMEIDSILPNAEKELLANQDRFFQVIGAKRRFRFEELEEIIAPVMDELSMEWNEAFHAKEERYLDSYQQGTLSLAGRECCRKLEEILRPVSSLHLAMNPEISRFFQSFSLIRNEEQAESFRWVVSPAARPETQGEKLNFAASVRLAILRSIEDYRERREGQLRKMIEESRQRMDREMQKLMEVLHKNIEILTGNIENESQLQQKLEKLQQTECDCDRLYDQFLKEMS
ncbi:MAG: dynamin family protein [Lachnospiraceae bacterium]|nr:dynamin family protein [Lachnospiraceae bacterium]